VADYIGYEFAPYFSTALGVKGTLLYMTARLVLDSFAENMAKQTSRGA